MVLQRVLSVLVVDKPVDNVENYLEKFRLLR